jgi:hypothetical protein
MEILERAPIQDWAGPFSEEISHEAVTGLERGKILLTPKLRFGVLPTEERFLSAKYLSGKSKNISFNLDSQVLGGTECEAPDRQGLAAMMRRFAEHAVRLLRVLCPMYARELTPGLASFRPAEISGRASSWRKDDTRLHIDAFPSRPSRGKRILRLFANVNPSEPRVWRTGQPFESAARVLLPRVRAPLPGALSLMAAVRITKGRRTLYDHYMLGLHDAMKADTRYQTEAPQTRIEFAPGAVWLCFTDCVSHAAMSGQHAFEQTFYLPVSGMVTPVQSPLRILEGLLRRTLV